MARRKIEMLEIREVIYQWQKGKRSRAISRSLGASRNTVKGLLRKAQLLGLKPESEPEEGPVLGFQRFEATCVKLTLNWEFFNNAFVRRLSLSDGKF